MSTPQIRLSIAEAQLALMGEEPKEGDPSDWAAKRKHYQQQRADALAEIGEAQHTNLPYRDDE